MLDQAITVSNGSPFQSKLKISRQKLFWSSAVLLSLKSSLAWQVVSALGATEGILSVFAPLLCTCTTFLCCWYGIKLAAARCSSTHANGCFGRIGLNYNMLQMQAHMLSTNN